MSDICSCKRQIIRVLRCFDLVDTPTNFHDFILAAFWKSAKKEEATPPVRLRRMDPPSKPNLTPQFCFNQTALKDFLRISRGMIDDSIIQNLNALMTPSQRPWDPTSTAERQISPPERSPTDPTACEGFKSDVLFKSWQARSDVLNYCAGVALNPDDPDLALKEAETAKDKERVIDERLDPYSGRFFPREARTEVLANIIRNERSVESIIRARTWRLFTERCGASTDDWETALNKWREQKGR